jgi:hypothetical protein
VPDIPIGLCVANNFASSCSIEMTVNVDGSGTGVDYCDGDRAFTFNASVSDRRWSTLSPEYSSQKIRYATYSADNNPGLLTFARYDSNDNSIQLQAVC